MDLTEIILKNKRYREQIDKLDHKTLVLIAHDRQAALEAAHMGIEQEEPKKIDDFGYLEAVATALQKLAQKVLKERDQ